MCALLKKSAQVFVLAVLIGVVAAMPQDAAKPPVEIITSESEGPNLDGSYKFKWVVIISPKLLSIQSISGSSS